jgi:hypothetical protein
MMGRADFLFGDAADALDAAGHTAEADAVRREVVGRNVLDGRWTFQVVEEFDDLYYDAVRDHDAWVCERLMDGRRHVFEAELKQRRRTRGLSAHEYAPGDG